MAQVPQGTGGIRGSRQGPLPSARVPTFRRGLPVPPDRLAVGPASRRVPGRNSRRAGASLRPVSARPRGGTTARPRRGRRTVPICSGVESIPVWICAEWPTPCLREQTEQPRSAASSIGRVLPAVREMVVRGPARLLQEVEAVLGEFLGRPLNPLVEPSRCRQGRAPRPRSTPPPPVSRSPPRCPDPSQGFRATTGTGRPGRSAVSSTVEFIAFKTRVRLKVWTIVHVLAVSVCEIAGARTVDGLRSLFPERRGRVGEWFRLWRHLYPPDPAINPRVPTVCAAVASTVPTIQRMSLASRLAVLGAVAGGLG